LKPLLLIQEIRSWIQIYWADYRFRRKQPKPWRRTTLRDIPIAPIEEMLRRWAGGSIWRGGPQPEANQICPALTHYRGDEPAEDRAKAVANAERWPLRAQRMFWCGPIVDHFGHQLGEFGGRLLLSSLDQRHGQLLFLHPCGDRDFRQLLPWQQAWIRYLNPTDKPVCIRHGAFRARELVVIPQQQRLGCPPTSALLWALRQRSQSLTEQPLSKIILLSRARYSPAVCQRSLRGSIAGEAAFEDWMADRGVRIVHPETLAFEQQLRLLHNSQRIVVMEGSALHALELLGRQPTKQVFVIARRPSWPGMDLPLRSRFPKLIWLDAVDKLFWREPSNPRVKGIAIINWAVVLKALEQCFGLIQQAGDADKLREAGRLQIQQLKAQMALRLHNCGATDRQPGRAGGW